MYDTLAGRPAKGGREGLDGVCGMHSIRPSYFSQGLAGCDRNGAPTAANTWKPLPYCCNWICPAFATSLRQRTRSRAILWANYSEVLPTGVISFACRRTRISSSRITAVISFCSLFTICRGVPAARASQHPAHGALHRAGATRFKNFWRD